MTVQSGYLLSKYHFKVESTRADLEITVLLADQALSNSFIFSFVFTVLLKLFRSKSVGFFVLESVIV